MTDNLMIELSDIHLTLEGGSGKVNILRGVNLQVDKAETLAVVGPSGSGKTTTLMIMAGLERPSSGFVRVAGQNLTGMHEDALARFRRSNLGIVFQSFHLVPTMTALENTALPLEFAHRPDARDRAMHALAAVGLQGRAGHYPAQLSGGEQQRVALARAFAGEPRVILADEPTGNLDSETGRRVMEHLFSMQQKLDTTLVLITHDKTLAANCSRQVHMEDGMLHDGCPRCSAAPEPADSAETAPAR
jgi:putative ABC transport system ATP-binding protein